MSYKAARTLLRTTTAAQRLHATPDAAAGTRTYSGTKLTGTEAVGIATGSSDFSFPALAARVASLEAAHDFQVATSNAELSRSLRRPANARAPTPRADAMDLFPRDLESSILKNLARAGHHETFDNVRRRYFRDAKRRLENAKMLHAGQVYHEAGKRIIGLLLRQGAIPEEVYFGAVGREVGMRMLGAGVFELELDSREISFMSVVMREFCRSERALWA
ncbi:uncharacterized protein H6S33_008406 [Morchella sextelata]|uniref:uncharacterized protein n=1 Tax=Morchella sextelata TaxID=1174677 RepID=UPI001D039919|nr:uncharacterized protein H6S33_008406 [Morchella sextelata]KAH0602756.1 hypothetical protein H6S33_008406 [Morchella sextelata]